MVKNYTTKVPVEKSIMEIEYILAKNGATDILKKYDLNGKPVAILFRVNIKGQFYPYKLPMEEHKIVQLFKNEVAKKNLTKRFANDIEQARRTGWRIIKDWIDSQMALVEINIVELDQIFLPYLYDERNDESLYDKVKKVGMTKFLGYGGENE